MSKQEETIRRIVDELQQLPEEYLENVYEIIRTLRANLSAKSGQEEEGDSSQSRPFVDEIERVKEQTRDIRGRKGDQYFT